MIHSLVHTVEAKLLAHLSELSFGINASFRAAFYDYLAEILNSQMTISVYFVWFLDECLIQRTESGSQKACLHNPFLEIVKKVGADYARYPCLEICDENWCRVTSELMRT